MLRYDMTVKQLAGNLGKSAPLPILRQVAVHPVVAHGHGDCCWQTLQHASEPLFSTQKTMSVVETCFLWFEYPCEASRKILRLD